MGTKEKIRNILVFVAQDKQSLMESLSDEERSEVGSIERWSFKDVIVHTNYWWNNFISKLVDSTNGKEVSKPTDDINDVNDGILEKHMNDSWDEVLAEEDRVFTELDTWLEKLSEEDLTNNELHEWTHGRSLTSQMMGNCWHDEWHLSRYLVERDQLEKGVELQENFVAQLRVFPEWQPIAIYNLACFYSVSNMKKEAIVTLKKALEMNPEYKEWSKEDSDLDNIRDEPGYKEIYKE